MEDSGVATSASTLSTANANGSTASGIGLPLILDGNFFKVIAEDGLKVTGQCTLCPSRIMGLKTTTSNFNTHLKKMHPERHRIYEEYKLEKGQNVKKRRTSHEARSVIQYAGSSNRPVPTDLATVSTQRNGSTDGSGSAEEPLRDEEGFLQNINVEPPQKRKLSGSPGVTSTSTGTVRPGIPLPHRLKQGSIPAASLPPTIKARRKETDDVVFAFIIKSLSPPSLVESPHFTSLVSGLCATPRRVMSRSTLESRINMQSLVKRTKIVRSMDTAEVICVTVDAWTLWNDTLNTFIAMTAHWMGPSLNIQSALLSCQRFQQDLTYNKLVDIICDVLTVYSIPSEKIGCIVTNNASSLLPTRIYQIHTWENEDSGDGQDHFSTLFGLSNVVTNEDLSFYNISSIFSEAKSSGDAPPDFPSHYDCPTQTLIGVLATSTFETMSNPDHPSSYIFQLAVAKCQALWSACANKEAGERIQQVFGLEILIPNRLNWGSFLEAMDCLLAGRDVLDAIFKFFELPILGKKEIEFLEEYVKTMDPITDALSLLQDVNSDSYMGSFVPTILTVKEKLEELKTMNLKYTEPLVESLLSGLDGPFLDIITLDENARPLILASMLHPLYKVTWIPTDKLEELKGWYLEEAGNFGRMMESNSNSIKLVTAQSSSKSDESESESDIYGTNGESSKEDVSSILVEFLDYLEAPVEPVDGGQLDLFPNVKKLFITFNTAIASSVHVEKIINFSEVSFAPSSAILTNELLEKMLILKCN